MKVLFLSHLPHESHLEFAKHLNARIKILPLNWLVMLTKKVPLISYLHPIFSIILSFFIIVKEDVLLVDGASSLYVAASLKVRKKNLRIIYIDGDMFFYNIKKRNKFGGIVSFFFRKIDGIVSDSEQNKNLAREALDVPIEVLRPYPKEVRRLKIKRKNYGLYVGRLDPDKNIERIIEFGLQCPYFDKFLVVGDGTQRSYVKKMSSRNKKIIYMGKRSDISRFYSQCKFLVHIPDYDPHPCTTMEAALCGCYPIISKRVGTNYLFDGMFIAENPENFQEINKKISYIMKNEKKAEKLLKKAVKKFPTKEKSIKNFKHIFTKIMKGIGYSNEY